MFCCSLVVEIIISGVFAHISNNSRYTTISKSVVDSLGLKRRDQLKTDKIRLALTAKKVKNASFTCLDKFSFRLGDIPIHLRNAMEIDPDFSGPGKASIILK